ncbi:MAG: hypothetical protein J5J06_16110 [Phycisphaerae bacterium]|nr:hypothetical protein [Phycisphaerae bacterium]
MRASSILASLAILMFFSGCAARRPMRGRVDQPELGHHFLDFFFEDEHGRSMTLGNVLGDFTVIAFTRCDSDTHAESTDYLESIIKEHALDDSVRVRAVDVHWADRSCGTHKDCHLLGSTDKAISICDATGMIRKLYGATKLNELFLIGPDRRVIGKATMAYPDPLRHQLAIDVIRFRARLYETRPQELGN